MDILKWTRQQNAVEIRVALEKSDEELFEEDTTYEPMGEEVKARLLEELREESKPERPWWCLW